MAVELKHVDDFDLLSASARERLRNRVLDAGGNINRVADEIRTRLNDYDQQAQPSTSSQAERPMLVAQLAYLDELAKAQVPADTHEQRGLFSRLTRMFRRSG